MFATHFATHFATLRAALRRSLRSSIRGLAVLAWLAFSGTAWAQSDPYPRQPSTWYAERPGPYLLFAAGGSQYELDCRSVYYYVDDCSYGRAGAGKVGLGYRFGNIGVEGAYTDFGRARIDNGRTPRDTIRMRSLGVNAVFSMAFGPATEGLLRVGLADVRHARSDDIGGAQHLFTAAVGLGMVLHLGPHAALEIAWDATAGEGRETGSTTAGLISAGLRWSF